MEQCLNGCLHCPKVDVAITVERHYNNENKDKQEVHKAIPKVLTDTLCDNKLAILIRTNGRTSWKTGDLIWAGTLFFFFNDILSKIYIQTIY